MSSRKGELVLVIKQKRMWRETPCLNWSITPEANVADLRTRKKGFRGKSLRLEKENDFNMDRNQEG